MDEKGSPSIKKTIDDLLETSIIKEISRRNNKDFAQKLAVWLVRYILIISSMNESLKIDLEEVLFKLHGENLRKILEITERTFYKMKKDEERYNRYIWWTKKHPYLIIELKKKMVERICVLSGCVKPT